MDQDGDSFGIDFDDYPTENEDPEPSRNYKDALVNFTQRTQRTQGTFFEVGDRIEPENEFERELENYNCSLRRDYNDRDYISIGSSSLEWRRVVPDKGTFTQLVQTFNEKLRIREPQRNLLDGLDKAIQRRSKLQLYLSPCTSPNGFQDTLFRALLLCTHTQKRVFELLITHMDSLAQSEGEEPSKLAVTCVNQVRWLERIVDSASMLQLIFDRKIEKWSPAPRDYLIESLPEVLTDVSCQQDAVVALKDMILQTPEHNPLSYQTAIVGTLKLLRMNGETAKSIRQDLCRGLMHFGATLLPELVSFFLQTLTFDSTSSLRTILLQLSKNLKLASLRVDRSSGRATVDLVLLEMFSKISRYVQLEGQKGWKEVFTFFKTSDPDSSRLFDYFDVFLLFSLLATDSCPQSLTELFKAQLTSHPNPEDIINFALKHKEIASRYIQSLIRLAQQCLFASNDVLRSVGALIYKNLFLSVLSSRKDTFQSMLSHFSSSKVEAQVILTIVEELVSEHFEAIAPYTSKITNCLDHLDVLSSDSIKRLYKILILIYSHGTEQEDIQKTVSQCISKFTSSMNENEQIWGILGLLMQLEHRLAIQNSNREKDIEKLLDRLKRKSSTTRLRSVMYTELSDVLRNNIRSFKSEAVLKWVADLFTSFKRDFFIRRDSSHECLESGRRDCSLWLNTDSSRLIALVPLFKLLCGAAFLRQRWTNDDETQIAFDLHFNQLFFAFEANIALDKIKVEDNASKSSDVLFCVIEWIREIMNTFANCKSVDGFDSREMTFLWMRKRSLLTKCQEELVRSIETGRQWTLPVVSSHYRKVVVMTEGAMKRGRKSAAKKTKKAKITVKEEPVDEEENMFQENEDPVEESPEILLEKCENITINGLFARFGHLKLATIIRSLQYPPEKKTDQIFFLQEFSNVLKTVLSKRTVPWERKSDGVDGKFHGDPAVVWKLITRGVCLTWAVLNRIVKELRSSLNDSNVVDLPITSMNEVSHLMKCCLIIFSTVLSCEEISEVCSRAGRSSDIRQRKRKVLMEQIEKTILQETTRSQKSKSQVEKLGSQEDAERNLLLYLISVCEVAPSADVAVILVQAISSCSSWTEDLRDTMARNILQFLKREWSDEDDRTLKGHQLSSSVKSLLEKYLWFRPEKYQLCCILWLLANKVTELVPDDERRRSKMSSYENVEDPSLTVEDKQAMFYSFTRGSFAVIYKFFFSSLSTIVQKRVAPKEAFATGLISAQEIIRDWETSADIFCLLCLMLRVKELRSPSVLCTALKEGRKFLILFAKNSSFMYILEERVRFSALSAESSAILKSVQIGNRCLQNIGVYAKTARSVSLLKGLPELRAANELWMRSVRTAIVKLGCEEAFEIGRLKSRNLDGEEIQEEEEENSENVSHQNEEAERSSDESDVY